MASNNKSQPQNSRDTLVIKVDEILMSCSELNILSSSIKEGRSEKDKRNNQKEPLARSRSLDSTHVVSDHRLILSMLDHHLRQLQLKLRNMKHLQINVWEELEKLYTVKSLIKTFVSSKRELKEMETKISHLLHQLPSLFSKAEKQKASDGVQGDEDVVDQGGSYIYLPGIYSMEDLTNGVVFKQVIQKFTNLGFKEKICLLSFAVFPENREVHRKMLMYWWIGEKILSVEGAEEAVEKVLKEFTEKKLVEPVEERRKVALSSYKMSPFVHASVVFLSKELGIFDIYRPRKKPTMNNSNKGKVCLVEGSSSQAEAIHEIKTSRNHIETVFNVSECFPDFAYKWFKLSRTCSKSLKVLYLGRWERSKKRDIQVRDPHLMQCLKHLTNLRALSFQGIQTIRSLNSSVCELHKLLILDLRECSNLVTLPEKISSLKNLVYLDMTGCYMLEWIPFRLASLTNLEVLKGFVVSDEVYEGVACKLKYLKGLKKLRKLSIEIHRDGVGLGEMLEGILKLEALEKLKVRWRKNLEFIPEGFEKIAKLPDHLKKLELHEYPHEKLPTWLHPENLHHLNKFHIGEGKRLEGFGHLPQKATQCAVEVLRLTSLPKLKVEWRELKQIHFPNLTFLENYNCPGVTLTPCDGTGIWRSDQD